MVGFSLAESYCMSPQCDCRSVSIVVRPLERFADSEDVRRGGRLLRVSLDLDSGAVSPELDTALESQDESLLHLVRSELRSDALEFLRARWRRAKHQDDPHEWQSANWDAIDIEYMVPYHEIFPSQWDLCAFADRQRYWLLDYWCLRPGCKCTDVNVDFIPDGGGSQSAPGLVVDARNGRVVNPGTSELGPRLWADFMAQPDAGRILARRRQNILRVARGLPSVVKPPVQTSSPRVGRNEPCLCGSGKKFKRCCGR